MVMESDQPIQGVKSPISSFLFKIIIGIILPMSRPLRIEYPGAWYHIMNRGGRYEAIFEDKQFRNKLAGIKKIISKS